MSKDERTLGQIGYETFVPQGKWDKLPLHIQQQWEFTAKVISLETLRRSSATTGFHRKVNMTG